MKYPLSVIAIALALAGCHNNPVPEAKPSLTIPAQWRQQVGPSSPVEGGWWRNFHDAALNRYVDAALRNNSDVLIARERINEYQARVDAAQGNQWPTLTAGFGGTRARGQSAATGLPVYSTLYKGNLSASYNVDLWGQYSSAEKAAVASLDAQRAAASAADLSIASAVAAGYITMLSLDQQLKVTQETLASREDAYKLAKRQYASGYTSELELMQADSSLRATRAQIPTIRHQIAAQENALNVLVGNNPGSASRGGDFDNLTPLTIPSQMPSTLLNRRPDIVQAQRQLLATDKSLDSSKAQLLPGINLVAGASLQDRSLSGLLGNPLELWSIGGSILAPLLNREVLNAQVDVAQSQKNQALYGYEKTVRTAFQQVDDSLDAISNLQLQEQELEGQVKVAQETLRIAHNRYTNGYSSYLDELTARQTLYTAQINLVQTRSNLMLAQVDLYKALGGGWTGL